MSPGELALHLESAVMQHLHIVCDFSMKLYKEKNELSELVAQLKEENMKYRRLLGEKISDKEQEKLSDSSYVPVSC